MTVNEEAGLKHSQIGKIPEDWGTISFDEAVSYIVDNRGKTAPTSEDGIALIATNCIKEHALYPVKQKIRYVSQETFENWFRDHPKPDDIIIVNKGTPGMVCLVPNPVDFVIAQDMVAVRPNKNKIYGRFLFAFMRSRIFKYEVDSLNVGTTIPHLKKTYFPLLIVPLPSKCEQIAIGDFYYNLSKKIEVNLKMNETLEAICQAVFKRWFVDFEFPDEEGKPYKSSGGEMIDSERGEIPKVWSTTELKNLGNVVCGKTPPKANKDFFGGDVPFIKIPDMHTQLFVINTEDSLTDEGKLFQANKSVPANSICVSCIATVGLVSITSKESQTNQQINCISPHEGVYMPYLFFTMKSLKRELEELGSGGSATLNVNTTTFSNILIIDPETEIVKEFYRIITPLLLKIRTNMIENYTLSQIRDRLLPKLMSGKIRVPIQKNVEVK